MESALGVQILATESIKPSCPTPPHLRNFKLSLLDQITYPVYMIGIYFYKISDDTEGDVNVKADRISQRLKLSLSETLTKFYPFAGRIKDDFSVDCNDDGVIYIEARANCILSEYLQNPDRKLLSELHPFGTESIIAGKGPLLVVQVTFFKCGGLAIAGCFSHKFIDALSFTTLLDSWSATTRGQSCKEPKYVAAASVFPPSESFVPVPVHFSPRERIESRRFVFDASKIAELKAKVASASVPRPSRIDALTALIWKCARAASRSNRGFSRPSLIIHAMNMRMAVVPPLPDNTVGNSVGYLSAQTSEQEVELQDLVTILWKAKKEFSKTGLQTLLETKSVINIPESIKDKFEREEIDFYTFTSMASFPVYQSVDFGWGKPIHMTIPNYEIPDLVMFIATEDGTGIDALVSLSPEDMALFERNKELLAFATLNPPIKEKVPHVLKSSL